jgi:RNA polymerase sigma-70 factor, ECF subfamily
MDHADATIVSGEEIGRYREQLLRFARARLRNPAHAEDAVQYALGAAVAADRSFQGRAALGTWLTGILKHKIVDCVRRTARDQCEPLCEHTAVCDTGNPAQLFATRRSLGEVDRRLAALPRQAAEVLVMRDVLGMSTEEACRALSISANYCAVLLHRARRRLRAGLAEAGVETTA